jgi:hypothetical protein
VVSHPGRHVAGTQVAPPDRGAAGTVAEVTESVVGAVVVRRASARRPCPGCCQSARLESDGYPARRASQCILAVLFEGNANHVIYSPYSQSRIHRHWFCTTESAALQQWFRLLFKLDIFEAFADSLGYIGFTDLGISLIFVGVMQRYGAPQLFLGQFNPKEHNAAAIGTHDCLILWKLDMSNQTSLISQIFESFLRPNVMDLGLKYRGRTPH